MNRAALRSGLAAVVIVSAGVVAVPPASADEADDLSHFPKGPPPKTAQVGDRYVVGGKGFNPVGTDYDEIKAAQPCLEGKGVDNLREKMRAFNEKGDRVYKRNSKIGTIQLHVAKNGTFIVYRADDATKGIVWNSWGGGHHRFVASMMSGVEILAEVVAATPNQDFLTWASWKEIYYSDKCTPQNHPALEPQPNQEQAKEVSRATNRARTTATDTRNVHEYAEGGTDVSGNPAAVEFAVQKYSRTAYDVLVSWGDGSNSRARIPSGSGAHVFILEKDYANSSTDTSYGVTLRAADTPILLPHTSYTTVEARATTYSSC